MLATMVATAILTIAILILEDIHHRRQEDGAGAGDDQSNQDLAAAVKVNVLHRQRVRVEHRAARDVAKVGERLAARGPGHLLVEYQHHAGDEKARGDQLD